MTTEKLDKKSTNIKSKSKRGGVRQGSGRPKGAQNQSTKALKDIAACHGSDMIAVLVSIANGDDAGNVRIQAAIAVLDRGYGRPSQTVEIDTAEFEPMNIAKLDAMFDAAMKKAKADKIEVMERRKLIPWLQPAHIDH